MSDDAEARRNLDAWIAELERLGSDVVKATAAEAVPDVLAAAQATANAGTTPEGNPWEPKKKGGRALPNAAKAITVHATGSVITITLAPPYTFHQYGVGESTPQRQIIPSGVLPAGIARALQRAVERAFRRLIR